MGAFCVLWLLYTRVYSAWATCEQEMLNNPLYRIIHLNYENQAAGWFVKQVGTVPLQRGLDILQRNTLSSMKIEEEEEKKK